MDEIIGGNVLEKIWNDELGLSIKKSMFKYILID